MSTSPPVAEEVVWHDAENGSYSADLALWRRLAAELGGPVVDLGAGTGRVALDLAAAGYEVIAVDTRSELLEALAERAAERGLRIETVLQDARELDLGRRFPLILAPMQLLHIVGGPDGRVRLLRAVASHLESAGRFAAALLDDDYAEGRGTPDPLPDVREVGDWVFSSLPTEIRIARASIVMRRLRQRVAPDGALTERPWSIALDRFSMASFDAEAHASGLRVVDAEMVPSSHMYEDSIAMMLELTDE